MARLVNEPVEVSLVKDEAWDAMRPAQFRRGKVRYVVTEVLDRWEEAGRWWEQEPPATVWRVR